MWRCGATGRPTGSRSPRPPTPCSRPGRPRRRSWSTSTPGPPTAAASSSTRPGTGRYHSYLCDEVVPWVDARYRTLAAAGHRAIMGKSSGGFGAMITPMLRPDLFGALATHAGDSLYELCYMPEFGKDVRHLRDYDGDIWRWWDDFRSRTSFTKEADTDLLRLLGVAACFSARAGRHRRAAVRPAHRGAPPAGVAALAGLGPGPDGAALRRRAAVAAGDLDRRRDQGRMVPRRGGGGVPGGAARRRACPTR